MNKQEKIIVCLLVVALVGWLWNASSQQKKRAETMAAQQVQQAQQAAPQSSAPAAQPAPAPVAQPPAAEPPKPPKVKVPEQLLQLANDQVALTLSTRGAVVKSAKMLQYAQRPGEISEKDNPALVLDFSAAPALALEGLDGVDADEDFEIAEKGDGFVKFKNAFLTRTVTLKPNYCIDVTEEFANPNNAAKNRISLGAVSMGASKNDILSVDSFSLAGSKVVHHGDDGDSPLKGYLVATAGGCSGPGKVDGMAVSTSVDCPAGQRWVAVKNRFFVSAMAYCSDTNEGFRTTVTRDGTKPTYVLKHVAAAVMFPGTSAKREYKLYIGPKKQTLLWDLGMKDVMEFGMWRWLCYPMVWVLNLFNSIIPNYGVAIILLTILVRLIFWPLTHKSTIGMRKMQEIQPLIKDVQKQFKDNPQRLQQEMMRIYRDNHVNPLASCLPMLVQIPVFIALFNVLRSAVELRYAPFLWISDLSEPEALFASWFPIGGGLNILPIAMAALTMLQSAFTPSGDNKQQRMMMIMMPLMMLFMFYNFPSALSLYWALSTAFGVVQAWWIKKNYGTPSPKKSADGVVEPDAVEMPQTRQMRRHG